MNCLQCQAEISDDSRFCSKCGAPIHSEDEIMASHTRTILRPIEDIAPGTILCDKYKIIEVSGRGGMGIVYRAEDTQLKRHVALKFMPTELTQNEEAKDRFIIEARAAAALSHPNICTIHEIQEEKERSFIAMEFVDGQSLKQRIEQGPLDVNEALDIAIQVAQGLEEAHGKGIVHRDIKSANIMLSEKGKPKVMDFGLAKVKGGTLLTREGTTLGTVAYMSPEQARGEEVDQRSDLWSFGVVLYEMLSGQLPFEGEREASILYSVVHEEPKSLKEINSEIPVELDRIIQRALQKQPGSRYSSASEMLTDLNKYQDSLRVEELGGLSWKSLLAKIREPRFAISALAVVLSVCLGAVWYFNRQAKIRWAKQEVLPEIERLVETNWRDFTEAYKLAEQAEQIIPNDPRLAELIAKCSLKINIDTEPQGASIYMKEYRDPASDWQYLGESPIESIRLPIGIFRWKMEKEGHETILAASSTWAISMGKALLVPNHLKRVLEEKASVPDSMVRITGAETSAGKLGDFFIDKYEVTNAQFKKFIDSGGYRNKEYWKHAFVKDGKELAWEEVMAKFVDQTGRPGPSTWQAGTYLEGQEDHPVSGISWYEAAAYAEFAGKSLPTGTHWGLARGDATQIIMFPQLGGYAIFAPFSNFQGKEPVPVGSLPGITSYGAYDMAGNVREWCWNETSMGRLIRGGAWNDNHYMFNILSQAPAFDRSPTNGFRCALYLDQEKIPDSTFGFQNTDKRFWDAPQDFYKTEPVSEEVFQVYKEQFFYDKTELDPRLEKKDDSSMFWVHETVTFNAAYGGEKILAHLFLPKNSEPPYQTVIYFPGGAARMQESSQNMIHYYEFESFLSFIVKNGRAVLFPIYKGTFERRDDALLPLDLNKYSHQYTEFRIKLAKDFKRCVDYLETREDIDSQKLAYYGMSWGAIIGGIIPAIEERLEACILLAGGLTGEGRPQVNQINYIPRIKIPTLMMNGKYDTFFILETSVKPMFNLLGTPAEHKKLILYETDHIPPMNEFIKESLSWLDLYLGPAK